MSWSLTLEQEEKVVRPLLDIRERHLSHEHPIGTSNPALSPKKGRWRNGFELKVSDVGDD